jgi:hypothetical protein
LSTKLPQRASSSKATCTNPTGPPASSASTVKVLAPEESRDDHTDRRSVMTSPSRNASVYAPR